MPCYLVQLPVAAGLDRRSKLDQGGFLKMAADHHQTDRQAVDTATWHGEGRISGYVERTGIGLHVERRVNQGAQWRIGRRYRSGREWNRRHRQHVELFQRRI